MKLIYRSPFVMKCIVCGQDLNPWMKDLFDDRHGYPGHFDVLRCSHCHLGVTSPSLSPKEIAGVYAKYYPWHKVDVSKIDIKNHQPKPWFELWMKGLLLDAHRWIEPGSTVLDVGCGVGYSLLELKAMGCHPYGIDPEPTGRTLAKKFDIKFHQGTIQDQPFGTMKFDYITASQVLEHTSDPISFLESCKKRLKPNGKIILAFPNIDSLTRKVFKERWLHWHIPYHYWYFSQKSICHLANECKLNIEQLITITPNMWTNLQIRHLLMKHTPNLRDTFWDGGNRQEIATPSMSLLTKVWSLMENYNFINRIIDFTNQGDSWVIILKSH